MIAAWDRGEAWDALPESAQGDETWQRDLWRRLSAVLADHPHPAVRLRDLVTRIHAGQGDVPTSLKVLATGPVGLEFRIRSLNRGLGHHCVAPEF